MRLFYLLLAFLFLISCSDEKKPVIKDDSNPAIEIKTSPEISILNKKIIQNPDNPELYHLRAKEFLKLREIQPALDDANRAILIDSLNPVFLNTRAEIKFILKDPRGAKADYEASIKSDPENEEALLKLAELYLFMDDYKKTIELLNRAEKVNKLNPKVSFIRGMTFKQMGDTATAIKNMQNAIEIDPDYYNAYMQLGVMLVAKKDPLTEGYLNNALRINPESTEALYALGVFYQETGKYNKALETYTALLDIDPNNPNAYYNMGYINYEFLKVYDVARKHFDTACQLNPQYAEALYMRGLCNEALGDVKKAEEDYRSALKVRPNYEKAIKGLNRVVR